MYHSVFFLVLLCVIGVTNSAPVYPQLQESKYMIFNKSEPPNKPYIEVKNVTYHGIGPREEARAMCSVKTQEINATANATITRRLHGVVTSRELHSSIQRLEVIIYGQMQQLWQSLDALRTQLTDQTGVLARYPDRKTIPLVIHQYSPRRSL